MPCFQFVIEVTLQGDEKFGCDHSHMRYRVDSARRPKFRTAPGPDTESTFNLYSEILRLFLAHLRHVCVRSVANSNIEVYSLFAHCVTLGKSILDQLRLMVA